MMLIVLKPLLKSQKQQAQKNRNQCGFFNAYQVGALREIRTPDPLVRSQVLYPAEL